MNEHEKTVWDNCLKMWKAIADLSAKGYADWGGPLSYTIKETAIINTLPDTPLPVHRCFLCEEYFLAEQCPLEAHYYAERDEDEAFTCSGVCEHLGPYSKWWSSVQQADYEAAELHAGEFYALLQKVQQLHAKGKLMQEV